jgi:hypothetical protein
MDTACCVPGGAAVSDSAEGYETLTFVVLLWHETDGDGRDHWRGRVEHVASQEVGYVEDVLGVARFIERWTRPRGEESTEHA